MFQDRNGDGQPDGGFSDMFGHIDVLKVYPPHWIFGEPTITYEGRYVKNPIRNRLQLLNQGRRIREIVNINAHYNFHASGWLRNHVKSPTHNPAEVKPLEVVHATERGNLFMSTGPFLEVTLAAEARSAPRRSPATFFPCPPARLCSR